jgi:SAM-dependent methyltransferase
MMQIEVVNHKKEISRNPYDKITIELNSSPHCGSTLFLNYGYIADGRARRRCPETTGESKDVSANLVLEVIGASDLRDKDILDVGCGRGGTIALIARCFPFTRSITGMDLSPQAIAFCRQAHAATLARFLVADAERLPIPDASIDVLLNIESACVYPHVRTFYRQAHRVLRKGGRLLYADCLDAQAVDSRKAYLSRLGFQISDFRDITANVLLSCDQTARSRYEQVRGGRPLDAKSAKNLANLICVPGSRKFRKFLNGLRRYVVIELIKEK